MLEFYLSIMKLFKDSWKVASRSETSMIKKCLGLDWFPMKCNKLFPSVDINYETDSISLSKQNHQSTCAELSRNSNLAFGFTPKPCCRWNKNKYQILVKELYQFLILMSERSTQFNTIPFISICTSICRYILAQSTALRVAVITSSGV